MKSLLKIFFIIILLFILYANTSYAAEQPLQLNEFIRLASENDTVFEEILIKKLSLKYAKTLNLPASDIIVDIKTQHSFLKPTDNSDTENSISLSKLFPRAGTNISLGYASSLKTSTGAVTGTFDLEISQPLAENAFGRQTRLLDKITGIETDVAQYQIIEAYEDYLASLIQLYYDWLAAYEALKTSEGAYNENNKLLENIKERQKSNIALPIDVNKINLQVLSKEENLIQKKVNYVNLLTKINEAIRNTSKNVFIPVSTNDYANIKTSAADNFAVFKNNSRTSQIIKLLNEKSSLEVDRFADTLLPSIDLFAGLSRTGTDHNINHSDRKIYAGLKIEFGITDSQAKAELEIAKIEESKQRLTGQNIFSRIKTNFNSLIENMTSERNLIDRAKRKIELAKSIVEDEKKDYSLGKTRLNDLIDEINRLDENKFSMILRRIQLKKLTVEYLRLTDQLVMDLPSFQAHSHQH